MAICRMCHKKIPDGFEFCEECEQKRTNQADESYLDSLLSLVSENDSSSGVSRLSGSVSDESDEVTKSIADDDSQDNISDDMINDILSSMDGSVSDSEDSVMNTNEQDIDPIASDDIDSIFSDIESGLDSGLPDLIDEVAPNDDISSTETDEITPDQDESFSGADISSEELITDSSIAEDITIDAYSNDSSDTDNNDSSVEAELEDNTDISNANDISEVNAVCDVSDLIDLMSEDSVSPFEASGIEIDSDDSETLISPFEDMGASADSTDNLLSDITSSTDIDSIIDNIGTEDLESEMKKLMPDEQTSSDNAPKKKSLFMRLFGNVVVERTPEELEAYKKQLAEEEQKKQEAKEQKKQKQAQSKEQKAAEKEQKKAEKAEADKAKAEAKKKAKEEAKEKARKKKEERLALEEEEVDEGRINRVGASILFVIFAAITILIIFGSSIYSYNLSIKNAQREFDIRHYNEAYYEVYGIDIKEDDIALYDKIMTVMYVNTQLNAYEYYMTSGCREKALDSLLKGLARYDKYKMLASILDIEDDLLYVRNNILEQLQTEFNLSEEEACGMMDITDTIDYSDYMYDLLGTYEVEGVE